MDDVNDFIQRPKLGTSLTGWGGGETEEVMPVSPALCGPAAHIPASQMLTQHFAERVAKGWEGEKESKGPSRDESQSILLLLKVLMTEIK